MTESAHYDKPELTVFPDSAELCRAAAREFISTAKASTAASGRFTVALSGGNTPRNVYSLIAEQSTDTLAWNKIFVFFGDERSVPPSDPESNYRMANESLLSRVPIPRQNVFRVAAELPPEHAAQEYENSLREFFQLAPNALPRFDLVLLGMGEDGHTASLFPGSPALTESSRLVVSNWIEKFKTYRITFTFPVLNAAAEVLFLISGVQKAAVLREVFAPQNRAAYPSQLVRPRNGRLLWLADRQAASQLK